MPESRDDRENCHLIVQRGIERDVFPALYSNDGASALGSPGWSADVSFSLDWSIERHQVELIHQLLEDATYQMAIASSDGTKVECQIIDLDTDDFLEFGIIVVGDTSHPRFLLRKSD